jgi:hypothetical protein
MNYFPICVFSIIFQSKLSAKKPVGALLQSAKCFLETKNRTGPELKREAKLTLGTNNAVSFADVKKESRTR